MSKQGQDNATARPWRVELGSSTSGETHGQVLDADGFRLFSFHYRADAPSIGEEIAAGVRAVNAHEALVGAVSSLLAFLEEHPDWTREHFTHDDPHTWEAVWIDNARAALALARGDA